MVTTFDTLEYVHKLKEAGVPEKQAVTHAKALSEVIEGNLATKYDLELIKREIELLRRDIKEIENRIIIRLGAIMITGFSILAILMKVL